MRFEIDFLESYDAESIIGELKRVAAVLGKPTVSAKDLEAHGRVKYHVVVNHFGCLRKALLAAGLKPSRFTKATNEELLEILAGLWEVTLRESGQRPRANDVAKHGCPVGVATIVKRFGSWKRALIETAKAQADGVTAEKKVVRKRRHRIPVSTRFLVLKRDLYRCRICNRSGVELEVDHIVPLNRGGTDRLDNLQTACRDCNRGKGDRLQ